MTWPIDGWQKLAKEEGIRRRGEVMKGKELFLYMLFIPIAVTTLPQKSDADTSFDIHMLYKLVGISDQRVSVKPDWLITNTSSQPLIIGDAGLIPFATMNFGTLPIQSPEFVFHQDVISGYTLNPGETIGWTPFPTFPHILVPPTYDLTTIPLFEFNGDYIPGEGTGNLRFGFGSAYVDVPITFKVEAQHEPPYLYGYITGTFSSIPEPATLLLFTLAGLFLRKRK
jgi:hypothetical protein